MNKLEEQIDNQTALFYMQAPSKTHSNFGAGAKFVIDLELPVKFAEYMAEQIKMGLRFNKKGGTWYFKGPEAAVCKTAETTMQIYTEWIENIYGK